MVWKLTHKVHRVFPRNPLVAVVADLRYHPILKIQAHVADFQDAVRAEFPDYQEQAQQHVMVQPSGEVQVANDKVFIFRKADVATLTLSTSALTLDVRKHERREELMSAMQLGVDALLKQYASLKAMRFGLRYINIIDRERISNDLNEAVAWGDLVQGSFASILPRLTDEDRTLYGVEVSSPLETGGMTVRYGILQDPRDGRVKFRFDSDRYLEEDLDPRGVHDIMEGFADDIYAMFIEAQGPALKRWMEQGETTT